VSKAESWPDLEGFKVEQKQQEVTEMRIKTKKTEREGIYMAGSSAK